MTWSVVDDYTLPASGEIRFSWIRSMYDQSASKKKLSNYYRGGSVVSGSTYKNTALNKDNTTVDISYGNNVTNVSDDEDDGISMKSFYGAFKEYEDAPSTVDGYTITHTTNAARKKIIRYRFTDTVYQTTTDGTTNKGNPGITLNCTATNIKIILHVPASVTVYGGPGGGGTAGTPGTGGSAGVSAGIGATVHSFYAPNGYGAIGDLNTVGNDATVGGGAGGAGGDCLSVVAMANDLILYNLGTLKPGGGGGGGSGAGGGGGGGGSGGGGGIGAMGVCPSNGTTDVIGTTVSYIRNRGTDNLNVAANMGDCYWLLDYVQSLWPNPYRIRIYWLGRLIYTANFFNAVNTWTVTAYGHSFYRGDSFIGWNTTTLTQYYDIGLAGTTIPYPSGDGGNGGVGLAGLPGSSIAGKIGSYHNGTGEQNTTGNTALATGGSTYSPAGGPPTFPYSLYNFPAGSSQPRLIAGIAGSGGNGGVGGGAGGYATGGGGGTFGGAGTAGGDGGTGGDGGDGGNGGTGSGSTATGYSVSHPFYVGATSGGSKRNGRGGGSGSTGGTGGAGGDIRTGATPTGTVTTIGGW